MEKSSLKVYFKYVQEVLGIRQIFTKSSSMESAVQENITVLIAVKDLKSYNLEENNLLEKMISALKLTPEQMLIIDRADLAPLSRYRLNLNDEAADSLTTDPSLFNTWSPRHLLQNPGLKKDAWAVMQKLLQKINP